LKPTDIEVHNLDVSLPSNPVASFILEPVFYCGRYTTFVKQTVYVTKHFSPSCSYWSQFSSFAEFYLVSEASHFAAM
jgi:hypothetical protein